MLALLVLPALLGTAFLIGEISDDDDTQDDQDTGVTPPLTNSNDLLIGDETDQNWHAGNGDDSVSGLGGEDTLAGGNGNDLLDGGQGNDTLSGGSGNDSLLGGEGDDRIWGNDGNDQVNGDLGNDRVNLGRGNDVYFSDIAGNPETDSDSVRGGDGNDSITDSAGSNALHGEDGNDVLNALDGGTYLDWGADDTLNGGEGNDTLLGDDGDTMIGGEGEDLFEAHYTYDNGMVGVVIEDFEPAEDALVLNLSETQFASDPDNIEVTTTFNEDSGDITVAAGGTVVATLQNMSADDVDNLIVNVIVQS